MIRTEPDAETDKSLPVWEEWIEMLASPFYGVLADVSSRMGRVD